MLHGLTSSYTICWVASEHLFEEVESSFVEVWNELVKWSLLILAHLRHVLLIEGQLGQTRPVVHLGRASDLEYFG